MARLAPAASSARAARRARAGQSRGPAARSRGANGAPNFNRLTAADDTAQTIQVAASEVGTWNNLTKVEMHLMTGWGDNTLRLASVTTAGATATLKVQSPESTIVFARPFPHLGGQFGGFTKHAYYFENALELSGPARRMVPGREQERPVVQAPRRRGHDEGDGRRAGAGDHPEHRRHQHRRSGRVPLVPPAGVSVTNANHVHFERDIFTQMGATGLDLVSGTHDDMVIGNLVTDVAGNGISVGKFVASETTEQLDIEHNEVAYTAYTGISVGYGWTSTDAMSNNKINANDVHHVCQVLADGAALYTLSNQQPASEMQYNYRSP